jgi:hypothetical protein
MRTHPTGIGCAQFFLGATINGGRRTAYYDTEDATGKIRITPVRVCVLCVRAVMCPCVCPAAVCDTEYATGKIRIITPARVALER